MDYPAYPGRLPLKYDSAEQNVLLILVGFAVSVIATRSFLKLTGYPQIASGDFHIAHVLWGGLLLYSASLLSLIWRGQRIHLLSSLLTGIGFGLFIDEIGKFITRSNDYFYPLAAPLIYAFFLLSVVVYLWIRKFQTNQISNEVYRVLDILERGIDPNISSQELDYLKQHLRKINAYSAHLQHNRMAGYVLNILEAETIETRAKSHGILKKVQDHLLAAESRWIKPPRFKIALTLGFLFLALRGLLVAILILILFVEIVAPTSWQQVIATPWWDGNPIGAPRLILFTFVLFSEAVIGILLLAATGLLLAGHLRKGLMIGYWVLLFSLTILHLPIFYFEQFEVIFITLLQFSLLFGIIRYHHYYPNPKSSK